MTITDCARLLLSHFPYEERSIPDEAPYLGRNASVLAAMNAALEECYSKESPWIREDEKGDLLRPTTTITMSVIAGSRDAVVTVGWEDWMAGCGLVIEGHDIDNQIRDDKAECLLKFPYGGTTGTVEATVYHDCITLPAEVLLVIAPVRVDGRPIATLSTGGSVVNPLQVEDYGMHRQPEAYTAVSPRRLADIAGRVIGFTVESYAPDGVMVPINRIRLIGTVTQSSTITFKAKLRPPKLEDIQSTEPPPIPHEFAASVFLPIARQKLTASPFFRDQAGKEEIANAYKEAKSILTATNPKPARRLRFEPI